MVHIIDKKVLLSEQNRWIPLEAGDKQAGPGKKGTMSYKILHRHNLGSDMEHLNLVFDSLVSPDNNYVSILQTARASGLKNFPVPYILSNCHHSICAVGGTINEDDHVFGLGSAKKYGGIFVPPYKAILHQYMRERMAGCGMLILGSDSHTRYGAMGAMGFGEGGGEVVKQLLGRTYDIPYPKVIAVNLLGRPRPGVGPQDVALALIAATFNHGFTKNKVLEFVGGGISNLSMEYRMGIDVMTTESAALSSVWCTDEKTMEYLKSHGREADYHELRPDRTACYDGVIEIDLAKVESMIALPFHPGNAITIRQFNENMSHFIAEIEAEGTKIKGGTGEAFSISSHLRDGGFYIDQALVSGCSGGMFENISAMADILDGYSIGGDSPSLGINPASLPISAALMRSGIAERLTVSGATLRPCICGCCFGVTDVPANNQISIRHTTRNYPNREGSKTGQGQMAAVCLMDARSIAATVRNGGRLTAATDLEINYKKYAYAYNRSIYKRQVFDNFGKAEPETELKMGPDIKDWPEMFPLGRHLLFKVAGVYKGSLTTDDLVPSGDASSYRSNPDKISQYTLCSRDPEYVGRAEKIRRTEQIRRRRVHGAGDETVADCELNAILQWLAERESCTVSDIMIGSIIAGEKIGDGSSREQAASNQKVLGGLANLANEYATKRYRSNLINWGILPLRTEMQIVLSAGDYLYIRDIRKTLADGREQIVIEILDKQSVKAGGRINCTLDRLTEAERDILLSGCLINYYRR